MARLLNVAVLVLGVVAASAVVGTGVGLVVTRRIDPLSAAMVGGLALALVEAAMAVSHRLRVTPSVPGTWSGRAAVVAVAEVAALALAALLAPDRRATSASILVGLAAVLVLVVLVGVQATRDPGSTPPAPELDR